MVHVISARVRSVSRYKLEMLNGKFYTNIKSKIAGYYYNGKLIVTEGHNRVTAALELYRQNGDEYYFNELIRYSLKGYKEYPFPDAPNIFTEVNAPLSQTAPPAGFKTGEFPKTFEPENNN